MARTVSKFLKKERKKLGLDQKDFCKRTKISQSTLCKMESDKVGLSMDSAFKLNKHLKIPADKIFKEYGKTIPKTALKK